MHEMCRARGVFSPKLGIIIQDFARQLFDQLLAGSSYPDGRWRRRSHGFTRPTTRRGAKRPPPTVKPFYLETYFRLQPQARAEKPPPITIFTIAPPASDSVTNRRELEFSNQILKIKQDGTDRRAERQETAFCDFPFAFGPRRPYDY